MSKLNNQSELIVKNKLKQRFNLKWQENKLSKKQYNNLSSQNQLNKYNGWLEVQDKIQILPTINFNLRPSSTKIELIVIHSISLPENVFGDNCIKNVCDFFTNKLDCNKHSSFKSLQDVTVSAHFLISRKGSIFQFVNTFDRAWHAGQSSWQGNINCNDFSVGIELEGSDYSPYTKLQYSRLIALIKALRKIHPSINSVAGHCHIAPQRKNDPGNYFDWEKINTNFSDLIFGVSTKTS